MRAFRSLVPLALATAALLAGCGSTEEPSASASGEPAAASAPVTVTDARGKEIRLEKGPAKKVVALEWMEAETLVTLGAMPVGVADIKGYGTWVKAAPLDPSVQDVGTRGEPSADAIIKLEPDLIVMEEGGTPEQIEQLERYAPVLVIKGSDAKAGNIDQMRKNTRTIAKAVGKDAEATKAIAEFDAALAAGKAKIAAAGKGGSGFAMADGYEQGGAIKVRPFGKGSLVSDLIEELGLQNQWTGEVDAQWGLGETDVEGLTKLPGEITFFYSASEEDPFVEGLGTNPIWSALPFVTQGKVIKFDNGTWTFGGPASSRNIVDQVVAKLAP